MNWIDEIIAGVIDTYNTTDPYELCDILQIEIIKKESESPLLYNEDSVYVRNFNNNETIFIRNDLQINYERFYLRHELGHAILHPDLLCSYCTDLIPYGKLEKEANYFAFNLSGIDIDKEECEGYTISQIASYIEVPENVLLQVVAESLNG